MIPPEGPAVGIPARLGEVRRTTPPVPVAVAPPSVSRIASTVASSRIVRAAAERSASAAVPDPVKYGSLLAAEASPASAASSGSAIVVALPTDVIGPVRFAFVVTVAAFPAMFVWSPVFVPLDVPENVPDCVASVPSPSVVRCAVASASSSSARPAAVQGISSTSPEPAVERPSSLSVAETSWIFE